MKAYWWEPRAEPLAESDLGDCIGRLCNYQRRYGGVEAKARTALDGAHVVLDRN